MTDHAVAHSVAAISDDATTPAGAMDTPPGGTVTALGDLADAIVALPHAVPILVLTAPADLADGLDVCGFCPEDPYCGAPPDAGACWVCYRDDGALRVYREPCCAGCLHIALTYHRVVNADRCIRGGAAARAVWLEIPAAPAVGRAAA